MKKILCLAVVVSFAHCVGSAPQPISSGLRMDGRKYFFDSRMGVEYYIDENGNKQYMGDAQPVPQNYQPQIYQPQIELGKGMG